MSRKRVQANKEQLALQVSASYQSTEHGVYAESVKCRGYTGYSFLNGNSNMLLLIPVVSNVSVKYEEQASSMMSMPEQEPVL